MAALRKQYDSMLLQMAALRKENDALRQQLAAVALCPSDSSRSRGVGLIRPRSAVDSEALPGEQPGTPRDELPPGAATAHVMMTDSPAKVNPPEPKRAHGEQPPSPHGLLPAPEAGMGGVRPLRCGCG